MGSGDESGRETGSFAVWRLGLGYLDCRVMLDKGRLERNSEDQDAME